MSDFIREVDEEYRRDRVVNFLTKYQGALVGLVLAIILGTAVYRIYLHYQNQAAEAANARYDAATDLVRDGKGAEGQAAFDKLQSDGPAGYAMLARLKAVETLALRDPAAAVRGYDAIAGDAAKVRAKVKGLFALGIDEISCAYQNGAFDQMTAVGRDVITPLGLR